MEGNSMILTSLDIYNCKNGSEICQNQTCNFSKVKKYIKMTETNI